MCFTLSAISDDVTSGEALSGMKNGGPMRNDDFVGFASNYTWTFITGANGF